MPPAPPISCLAESLLVAIEKRDVVENWEEWFPQISLSLENLLSYKIIKSCVPFWKFNPNFVLVQSHQRFQRRLRKTPSIVWYVNDISIKLSTNKKDVPLNTWSLELPLNTLSLMGKREEGTSLSPNPVTNV